MQVGGEEQLERTFTKFSVTLYISNGANCHGDFIRMRYMNVRVWEELENIATQTTSVGQWGQEAWTLMTFCVRESWVHSISFDKNVLQDWCKKDYYGILTV